MTRRLSIVLGIVLLLGAAAMHMSGLLPHQGVTDVSAADLRERLDSGERLVVVDVRRAEDFAEENIDGAINIPHARFAARLHELPKDIPVVVVCYMGLLNRVDSRALAEDGHPSVLRLAGGMGAWRKQ